jgi:hypothetical protein
MKIARQVIQIKCNPVRLTRLCGPLDDARPVRQPADDGKFRFGRQSIEWCIRQSGVSGLGGAEHLGGKPQHGPAARVGVLDVKNRIVACLGDDLIEVEFHLGIGFAGQHGEADRILADLIDQVAQRDEAAGTFGHPDGLPAANNVHNLAQHNLQRGFAVGDSSNGGLEPRDITAVIGAEHVDQQFESA